MYTKRHIRNDIMSGSILFPGVWDIADFAAYTRTYVSDNINITVFILLFVSPSYNVRLGNNILCFGFSS
jgi:hypothetical protein